MNRTKIHFRSIVPNLYCPSTHFIKKIKIRDPVFFFRLENIS